MLPKLQKANSGTGRVKNNRLQRKSSRLAKEPEGAQVLGPYGMLGVGSEGAGA